MRINPITINNNRTNNNSKQNFGAITKPAFDYAYGLVKESSGATSMLEQILHKAYINRDVHVDIFSSPNNEINFLRLLSNDGRTFPGMIQLKAKTADDILVLLREGANKADEIVRSLPNEVYTTEYRLKCMTIPRPQQ